ncbi:MAG: YggT family protein [Chloroflexi bacterium]|nr:YggT family protein [Chloroflexota bacterium]
MSRFIGILISTFTNVMSTLIMIYIVFSWVLDPYNKYRMMLERLVNTFLDPIRRFMPRTGMIDFSPLIFLLLLQFMETVATSIFR